MMTVVYLEKETQKLVSKQIPKNNDIIEALAKKIAKEISSKNRLDIPFIFNIRRKVHFVDNTTALSVKISVLNSFFKELELLDCFEEADLVKNMKYFLLCLQEFIENNV